MPEKNWNGARLRSGPTVGLRPGSLSRRFDQRNVEVSGGQSGNEFSQANWRIDQRLVDRHHIGLNVPLTTATRAFSVRLRLWCFITAVRT